jgi:hypothetical protein
MNPSSDLDNGMKPLPLDPNTTDRLLRGAVKPDDAPPGYAEVARLVHAVIAEPSPGELAGKYEAVAAMARALGSRQATRRAAPSRATTLLKAKVAALLVGVTLLSGTNLALAGALPAPAQDAASAILAKVGVSVTPQADRPVMIGPAGSWLCRLEGGSSGRFGTAPVQSASEATQVAGETLREFCAKAPVARGPVIHRAPTASLSPSSR